MGPWLRGDSGRPAGSKDRQVPGVAPPRGPASRTPAWDRPPQETGSSPWAPARRPERWAAGSGLHGRSTAVQPQQKGELEGPHPEGLLEAQPREPCTHLVQCPFPEGPSCADPEPGFLQKQQTDGTLTTHQGEKASADVTSRHLGTP